jgi:hypothetical protein
LLVTPTTPAVVVTTPSSFASSYWNQQSQSHQQQSILLSNIQNWVRSSTTTTRSTILQDLFFVPPASAAETANPPTKQEIALLREAFATFYGTDRNPTKALDLLTQVLDAWQRQPGDERAGLYRVRGDCYMSVSQPLDAIKDYTTAIDLLQQRTFIVVKSRDDFDTLAPLLKLTFFYIHTKRFPPKIQRV